MQIISPNYILTPDLLLENQSIAFEKNIVKIAPIDELTALFPDAQVTTLPQNSLITPGFINAHVHLEFSANKTELSYGDFISWLYSVIENRADLIGGCGNECIKKSIDDMLRSGITTIGAISSHGMDLEACASAKQKVVFFNELIGSQANMADALFADFNERLNASISIDRDGFTPAVAIHSPYSVHPVLLKKGLQIAKEQSLKVSAHFMESQAEREWLDSAEGGFKEFFNSLLNQTRPTTDAVEFLENFNGIKTIFTHATKINDKELEIIKTNMHAIVHCPISNRLLGNGALDIDSLDNAKVPWICATDGLSSNYKLDLLEEIKCALFMHHNRPLLPLAKKLLRSITKDAADALGVNSGEIKEGKNADMLVFDLEKKPTPELPIHLILHRYNIAKIYINGALV